MEELLEGLWRLIKGFFRFLSSLLRVGEIIEAILDFFDMIREFFKWLWRKLFRRSDDPAPNKKNPGIDP
ncbi:MAG: hypothetical protein AB2404_00960 [Planifilum fimeticola]